MHCDGVFPPEIAELLQSGGLDTRWCIVLGFGTWRGEEEEEEEKRSRERMGGRAQLGVKDGKKNKSLADTPTSSHTSQNDSD